MKKTTLLIALFAATCVSLASHDAVSFKRTYTQGEKTTYSVSHSIKGATAKADTLDATITVNKVLDGGGADLTYHWSNVVPSSPSDPTKGGPDVTLKTGANNLPVDFKLSNGGLDFVVPLIQLASATTDKAPKVEQETPIKWTGGQMSFEGTIKIQALSDDNKSLKALVKVKMNFGGQDAGELSFTSTYDGANGKMTKSEGTWVVAGQNQIITVTLKP